MEARRNLGMRPGKALLPPSQILWRTGATFGSRQASPVGSIDVRLLRSKLFPLQSSKIEDEDEFEDEYD
jgi:hypothetical protein